MTQSDREFLDQILAGKISRTGVRTRLTITVPVWFSALALSVVALGAALGIAV